jgi:CHASE3 domain sensor protein/phage shock protein A
MDWGKGYVMHSDGFSPTAFHRLVTRSVIMPPALLGVLALVFLGQILYLLSAAQWVDHTDQVIARANILLNLLVDGETGMRGYLLTGDPVFLEPYHIEENQSGPTFVTLIELVSDNPAQVERLKALRTDQAGWQGFARRTIELRREGGDYQTPIRNGEDKRRMDSMREQVAGFINVEEGLRELRMRTAQRATWVIVGVSLGLALLSGGILALFTRRRLLLVSATYESALSEVKTQAESLRKSAHRLETLHQIDRAILAAESVSDMARSALRRMEQIVPSGEAFVVVFDGYSGPAQVISRNDRGTPMQTVDPAQSGGGSLDFSARDDLEVITDLAEVAGRSPMQDRLFRSGQRSYVAAALHSNRKRFGVLILADPRPSAFTGEHPQIADEVAQQLAIAFQQARLRKQLRQHADELERRVAERTRELQETLESVKQLQGLLPICAWCKKVRDDKDYWHEVEHFVAARTDVQFTHGMCPNCLKKNVATLE